MNLLHGVGEFFSLDIGTNSMRIVQLAGSAQHGWTLVNYAYVPVNPQLVQDSSDLGRKRLGEAIVNAATQAGIKTKNIALGLAAGKTFTSVVETETLPEKELQKSFRYEMDKYVPMPLSEAKADFVILGPGLNDPTKTEVLLSSASKEYVESMMEMVEKAGLNVIAMEPEPLAMARALNTPGAIDANMIVDFGEESTDLVIMYKDKPRLVRTIPGGMSLFANAIAASLGMDVKQARKYMLESGFAAGQYGEQIMGALGSQLDAYASELVKSIKFFQTKYLGAKVGGIVLSDYASIIPAFPEYIETKTGVSVMKGNPWQFVRMSSEQQKALAGVSCEFAVAIGLSERSND